MPLAAAGAAIGGAGQIASGIGGKKAQKQANQLAQTQLGLEKGQLEKGNQFAGAAGDYWNSLLHGGQAAVQATGPYASLIGQQGEGTRRSIMAQTPRGGEQNLALAQNSMQTGNNIARLYAGMQPAAAQGLGQIGNMFMGSGNALAYPASSAGMGAAGMGMQNAQGGAQGFGSLLYHSLNKLRQGSGGGGSGSAPDFSGFTYAGPGS